MASNSQIKDIVMSELSETTDLFYEDFMYKTITVVSEEESYKGPLLGTARIFDYVEKTVQSYGDAMFRSHFRMTRQSFEALLHTIGPHSEGRTISLERRTLACLWYVSNTETFRSVADRFGMSKGSLHYYIGNFCRTLTETTILTDMISLPSPDQYHDVAKKNSVRAGFPGSIGFLDGTYIPIPGPSHFRDSYICRKGFPAMHLQGACDSDLKFVDVYCAYPGSVHDARVFRNSPLATKLENGLFPPQFHLLGDSAYGLAPYLLVPYRDNGHLSPEEKRYNFAHSSTRVDIERCFGLLKGKFRKLKFLDMRKVKDIPSLIISCCVLHNFILDKERYADNEIDMDMECQNQLDTQTSNEQGSKTGIEKRSDITRLLA